MDGNGIGCDCGGDGECCSRSTTNRCCCRFITALTAIAIAIATLITMLVVAYAAVPARVTVEYAYLRRFALTNGTTLAYDVSLAIAVRNRNFATGVWRTAPLDAKLRFRGQTFARASAQLESAEWGLFKPRGKGMYRVTVSDMGAAPVVLGGDGVVSEFVKESVAGEFELELVVIGGEVKYVKEHHHGEDSSVVSVTIEDSSVIRVTCPLKLLLPTKTAQVVQFTSFKCT